MHDEVITLFYKPGHYDIIYTKKDIEKYPLLAEYDKDKVLVNESAQEADKALVNESAQEANNENESIKLEEEGKIPLIKIKHLEAKENENKEIGDDNNKETPEDTKDNEENDSNAKECDRWKVRRRRRKLK